MDSIVSVAAKSCSQRHSTSAYDDRSVESGEKSVIGYSPFWRVKARFKDCERLSISQSWLHGRELLGGEICSISRGNTFDNARLFVTRIGILKMLRRKAKIITPAGSLYTCKYPMLWLLAHVSESQCPCIVSGCRNVTRWTSWRALETSCVLWQTSTLVDQPDRAVCVKFFLFFWFLLFLVFIDLWHSEGQHLRLPHIDGLQSATHPNTLG